MTHGRWIGVAALLFASGCAEVRVPELLVEVPDIDQPDAGAPPDAGGIRIQAVADGGAPSAGAPGPRPSDPFAYLDDIGTPHRRCELVSNTAYRGDVFTERAAVDCAFGLFDSRALFVIVGTSFGTDLTTDTGFYDVRLPIFSAGLRLASDHYRFWIEGGLRLIPSWSGPSQTNLTAQALALNATLASGIADDAAWLPFSDTGVQVYGTVNTRLWTFGPSWLPMFIGGRYGGIASLAPMRVSSWLGPQAGFIGNGYAELFLALARLGDWKTRALVGVHGEASLSSIWPANDTLPLGFNLYVGNSPCSGFSWRLFGGWAGTLNTGLQAQLGGRLTFYWAEPGAFRR